MEKIIKNFDTCIQALDFIDDLAKNKISGILNCSPKIITVVNGDNPVKTETEFNWRVTYSQKI
jgi:hypothetical protein